MNTVTLRIGTLLTTAIIVISSGELAHAQWTQNGNNIYNSNSGYVGIGTTSPGATGALVEVGGAIRSYSANATVGVWGTGQTQFQIVNSAAGTDSKISEIIDQSGQIIFRTANDAYTNSQNYMQVGRTTNSFAISKVSFPNGNVGIGTTSPTAKLDVNGDVTVSGNISAKYQDIAEWVPTSQSIPAGSVVVLDDNRDNGVVLSSSSYDTRVAGVISDTPGLVLGESAANKVKVATTGRVKVHADASHGAIHRGDLLVTSDQPGAAKRSDPLEVGGRKFHQPGTIIGKALEGLSEGQGEILVLLSLQ